MEVYTDADWAGVVDDRKSTSGYCAFVGGNLVTWRSEKQSVVTRSSAQAEYRTMSHGVAEIMWIRNLLGELGFAVSNPMSLYCDNKVAINIVANPILHDRTKHIEVDKHFIREKLVNAEVCTPYVSSEEQLADIFTKGLHHVRHKDLCDKLGMIDIYAPT